MPRRASLRGRAAPERRPRAKPPSAINVVVRHHAATATWLPSPSGVPRRLASPAGPPSSSTSSTAEATRGRAASPSRRRAVPDRASSAWREASARRRRYRSGSSGARARMRAHRPGSPADRPRRPSELAAARCRRADVVVTPPPSADRRLAQPAADPRVPRAGHRLVRQPFHDMTCGVRGSARRAASRGLDLYGDQHRFIPVIARHGYRVSRSPAPNTPGTAGLRLLPGIYAAASSTSSPSTS